MKHADAHNYSALRSRARDLPPVYSRLFEGGIGIFEQELARQGIYPRHFSSRRSFYDFSDFLTLSGYLEPGRELADVIEKFAHRSPSVIGVDRPSRVAMIGTKNAELTPAGAYDLRPSFVVLVYRYWHDAAVQARHKIQETAGQVGLDVRPIYTERQSEIESSEPSIDGAVQVALPREIFREVCQDTDLDDDVWVLVNVADSRSVPEVVGKISRRATETTKLIAVCARTVSGPSFDLRSPERALAFAVRLGVLREHLSAPYSGHPMLLFATLWSRYSRYNQAVVSVDYFRVPPRSLAANLYRPEARFIDRLATRAYAEPLVRQDAASFSHLIDHLPHTSGTFSLSSEPAESLDIASLVPDTDRFDVIIVTDLRIRGGGVNSILAEAEVMRDLGFRVGVLQLDAVTLKTLDWVHQEDASGRLATLKIPLVNGLTSISTKLVLIRYPPVLAAMPAVLPRVDAENVVVVINQPPRRMVGDNLFYDPMECHDNARRIFGLEPHWWPNGPDARAAMETDAPLLRLAKADWSNIVASPSEDADVDARVRRVAEGRTFAIGRHTRDVINKWPSRSEVLLQAYPEEPPFAVHILGGARRAKRVLGKLPNNWRVWDYGELDVSTYLNGLDFFVFFPHEDRIEPMARCILEAMAAGMPVVLPTRFKGIYGNTPIYCEPSDVVPTIKALASDEEGYRAQCYRTREEAWSDFGPSALGERLNRLGVVPSVSVDEGLSAREAANG